MRVCSVSTLLTIPADCSLRISIKALGDGAMPNRSRIIQRSRSICRISVICKKQGGSKKLGAAISACRKINPRLGYGRAVTTAPPYLALQNFDPILARPNFYILPSLQSHIAKASLCSSAYQEPWFVIVLLISAQHQSGARHCFVEVSTSWVIQPRLKGHLSGF